MTLRCRSVIQSSSWYMLMPTSLFATSCVITWHRLVLNLTRSWDQMYVTKNKEDCRRWWCYMMYCCSGNASLVNSACRFENLSFFRSDANLSAISLNWRPISLREKVSSCVEDEDDADDDMFITLVRSKSWAMMMMETEGFARCRSSGL